MEAITKAKSPFDIIGSIAEALKPFGLSIEKVAINRTGGISISILAGNLILPDWWDKD
jgi:hypothetical protein